MRTGWLVVAIVGCSAPREPLTNTVAGGSAVRIGPSDPLGWLGLAPAPAHSETAPGYAPINAEHPLVTVAAHDELPSSVTAIGTSGGLHPFTTGPRTEIRYGCEENQLDVTTLAGPRLPPGAVWLLPPARPASWQPAALAITSRTQAPAQRTYAIGPLALELTRTGDLRGALTIRRDGRVVHTATFERHLMDGADTSPIDLAQGGPGIPEPIAAWSIAEVGPILLVLTQPGYEGTTLQPLLVEATSARAIESMVTYLYACAF